MLWLDPHGYSESKRISGTFKGISRFFRNLWEIWRIFWKLWGRRNLSEYLSGKFQWEISWCWCWGETWPWTSRAAARWGCDPSCAGSWKHFELIHEIQPPSSKTAENALRSNKIHSRFTFEGRPWSGSHCPWCHAGGMHPKRWQSIAHTVSTAWQQIQKQNEQ